MKIVEQSHEILNISGKLWLIELAGRTCYKSEDKITEDGSSAAKFTKMLIEHDHTAMLEHSSLTVKFVTDRGVTHELVRHREASYAQESTRYCNYSKGKFNNEITVIKPVGIEKGTYNYIIWEAACEDAERSYFRLLEGADGEKVSAEEARSVLPTCLKAEIVVTANFREWRHILKLRTASDAHPQIRALLKPLLEELKQEVPIIFDDL